MPRAGLPDDDLAPAPGPTASTASRRAVAVAVATLLAAGLALPAAHDRASGLSDRRLDLVGGPAARRAASGTPPTGRADADLPAPLDGPGAASASPAASVVAAQAGLPVRVGIGSAGAGGSDGTDGRGPVDSSGDATAPTDGLPIRSSTSPDPGGIASGPVGGSPRTGGAPTSTTTRAPTTTTTAPTTTTAAHRPCRRGVIDAEQSSFVIDGQSNSLSPSPERSYGFQLVERRWPTRTPFTRDVAVGGTSFDQRTGWASSKADAQIAALGQPCAVLLQEGGPTDLANGLTPEQLLQANQRYTAGRRAAGFDVIVGATVPRFGWITADQDARRLAYNDLLRQHWREIGLDHLVDVASIPELQHNDDTRYFIDTAHFTEAGAALVAQLYARTLP